MRKGQGRVRLVGNPTLEKTNAIGAFLGRKEQPDNGVISRRGVDPPRQLSRKLLSTLDRLGCLSFRNAFASI